MNGSKKKVNGKRRFRYDATGHILYSYKTAYKASRLGQRMETILLDNVASNGFKKIKDKEFVLTMNDGMTTYTFTDCNRGGDVGKVAMYIKRTLQNLSGDKVDYASFSTPTSMHQVITNGSMQRSTTYTDVDRRRRLLERLQGF